LILSQDQRNTHFSSSFPYIFFIFSLNMKSLIEQIPPIFKNMYVLGTVFFIVWLMIFDSNDILTQLSLRKKEADLQQTQRYYQKQIETVKTDREALFSNQDLLERIAREKYYMRAEGEDVYVMVPESTDE